MNTLYLYAVMLVMGLSTHWLKQLVMAKRTTGAMPSLRQYWLTNWPESLAALTSGVAGFVYLYEAETLTALSAFGVGYIANSVADMLGTRVQALIGATPPKPPVE